MITAAGDDAWLARQPSRAGGGAAGRSAETDPALRGFTGTEADVFAAALGTNRIDLDPVRLGHRSPENFDAVRHFDSVDDLTPCRRAPLRR